jgi:hypothetical protein
VSCPTPDKRSHATFGSAYRQLKLLDRAGKGANLHVYKCPAGHHFHVGHDLTGRIFKGLREDDSGRTAR